MRELAQLVLDGIAIVPRNIAKTRAQLGLIIEANRVHGLDVDDEEQMLVLERIAEALEQSEAGENRVQPLLDEWRRLKASWPTPNGTDEECDALSEAQGDLVHAAIDIAPTSLCE